jgi:hypothetical protein
MREIGFARRVFTWAGVYGLAALVPLYGLERTMGAMYPPAITHPEFFYGFAGVALAWQIAFLLIGRDPARLRPLMIPAVIEKLGYGAAVLVLVGLGRTAPPMAVTAIVDLGLAVLFAMAWARTRGVASGIRLS